MNVLIGQLTQKLYEPIENDQSVDRWKSDMFELIEKIAQLKVSETRTGDADEQNTSLDPSNWSSTTEIAHQMLDSSLSMIRHRREHPVWQPIPNDIRSAIENDPLPQHGQSLEMIHQSIVENIVPYTRGNTHPRFWGWVMGEGTVGGVLAEMLAATLNINAGGCTHSAVLIERTVIQWMREIFGFPPSHPGGILVSGTSMATVICLATARRQYLPNVRQEGIVNGPRFAVYASAEAHMCVSKALELLGFGSRAIRWIPVDENFSMKIDALKQAIAEDRQKGWIPFCLVGSAGTVNTGAFDNLLELSTIARAEKLWFHVDGAFGSLVILDPQRRHLVDGIEHADSLAFDFHKWLHCPYDAGCVLIRDGRRLIDTFSVHQSYLANTERGCAGDKPWFCDLGTELSRSFRALKVWVTLKEHGIVRLGQKIADNCEQAQYLASLLEKHPALIRVHRPVSLNIVNFRLEPTELQKFGDEYLDTFNNDVLADVQISGVAVASTTRIHARLYIRVCIVSHRCTWKDFDLFVDQLLSMHETRLRTSLSQ